MARSYFKVFHSDEKAIEHLTDAEAGRLFRAMLSYSITGEVPELRGNERYVFSTMQYRIDQEIEGYKNTVEINRANGSKGGRPKKTEKTDLVFEKPKESEKSQERRKKKEEKEYRTLSCESVHDAQAREADGDSSFVPPTPQDVLSFCAERGYSVDAEKFVARYAAVGWMLAGTPIRDWKSLVVCWVKRDDTATKPEKVRCGNFDTDDFFDAAIQRSYDYTNRDKS